jgi:capsular exopolysaccharide synthesis family protein
MEPIEYLRLMRRRWRLLVACVLVAGVAAFVTTPDEPTGGQVDWQAESTILRDASAGTPVALASVQLYMKTGEVPGRVGERLDYGGNPIRLARTLEFDSDETIGTLTVTATGSSRDEAADIANAFVEETLGFLAGRARDQQQDAAAELNERLSTLQSDIDQLEVSIDEAEESGAPTELFETQRDAKLRQYGAVLDQQQAQLDEPPPSAGYQVLEAAAADLASPKDGGFSAPKSKPVRTGFGALLGLLLGVAVVIVVERVDPHIYTREATEEAFSLPVVAEIPHEPAMIDSPTILTITEPASALAEAYRSLRAALLLMPTHVLRSTPLPGVVGTSPSMAEAPPEPHVVLVTSAAPGDGKTATVANLAATFAEAGRSVLVLGCDFRRPSIQRYFGVSEDTGIVDILQGRAGARELSDVIKPTSVPGVRIVTNGSPVANFGDVASAGRDLVAKARLWADVVLIDTAPMLATNDAIELVPAVDAVVLVCRSGKTTTDAARRSRALLERLNAPVTGIALIGAPVEQAYGSYYRYTTTPTKRRLFARLRRGRTPAHAPRPTISPSPGPGREDGPDRVETLAAAPLNGNGSKARRRRRSRARSRR